MDAEQQRVRLVMSAVTSGFLTALLVSDQLLAAAGFHIFFLADGRIRFILASLVQMATGWPIYLMARQRRVPVVCAVVSVGLYAVAAYQTWWPAGRSVGGPRLLFTFSAAFVTLGLCAALLPRRSS